MPNRTHLLLALTLVTPLASAQDATRRVEREASNPMRMIIEAAKIRPKAKAAEAARTAEVPRPPSRPAGETAAAPVAVESRPAPPSPPAAPVEQVAASAPVPVVTAAAEAPAPAAALPPAGPPESTVATVEATATPRSDSLVEAAKAAEEPEPAALKLANVVEPVTPRRLIGVLRGEVQVHVAFTVKADGSVADAEVRRSSHPTMDAAVLDAVRQWRYEPIAAARPHEVQLVLRPPE